VALEKSVPKGDSGRRAALRTVCLHKIDFLAEMRFNLSVMFSETTPDMQNYADWKTDAPAPVESLPSAELSQETGTEEREKEKTETLEYSLENVEGKYLGRATVELQTDVLEIQDQGVYKRYRQMKSFVFHGELDGQAKQKDVLEMVRRKVDKLGVLVPQDGEFSREFAASTMFSAEDPTKILANVARIPVPSSTVDVAISFHEFSHLAQRGNPALDSLREAAEGTDYGTLQRWEYADLKRQLEKVVALIPGAAAVLENSDAWQNLDKIEHEKMACLGEAKLVAAKIEGDGTRFDPIDALRHESLMRQISSYREDQQRILRDIGAIDAASIPRKFIEADASRIAIMWMREVRDETGVDLFDAVLVPKSVTFAGREHGDCSAAVESSQNNDDEDYVVTDAIQYLRQALDTYHAQDFDLPSAA
jgi:hypothetical protein